MVRPSKIAAGFVVGMVLSFSVGLYLGFALSTTQADARDMVVLAKYGVAIDIAANEGKPGSHEAALLEFVSYVEERESIGKSIFVEEWVATEAAISYLNLARTLESRGDANLADEYFKKSKQQCSESFLRNCSIEHLTRLAAEFSYSPMPEESN